MPERISPAEAERFLTVKEFAQLQGVSESTVRLWVRRNGLPHVKMGTTRIPPDAMERMLSMAPVSTNTSTR